MTIRRPLALGAAATIGFGSLFFASPALAEEASTPSTEQQAETPAPTAPAAPETTEEAPAPEKTGEAEVDPQLAAAQKIEEAGVPLIAFGENANGDTLAYTAEELSAPEEKALETFAAEAGAIEEGEEVTVISDRVSEPLTPYAEGDVVGGSGYVSYEGAVADWPKSACSIGFSAWTPGGDPAFLTAGHCSKENNYDEVALSIPSEQPAHLGAGAGDDQWLNNGTGKLGAFGFSQFGGPNNADAQSWEIKPGSNGSPDSAESYDLAAIDEVPGSFTLLPAVTDWSTAESDDLAGSTITITAVGAPQPGAVSKSGRTTGKTDGSITEEDIIRGYSLLWSDDTQTKARWVKGFASTVESAGGDSGGAVYQGNTAVGVISGGAGEDDRGELTWASLLSEVPAQLDGYAVQLHIDAPAAPGATEVYEGDSITGTAPAGATRVFVDGQEYPVTNGQYSFPAPGVGEHTVELVAGNGGYDRSAATSYTFEVLEESAVPAPAITSPANGSTVAGPVTEITGTGVAGATLNLSGDVNSEVEVAENGSWSVPTNLGAGEYTVQAAQTVEDENVAVLNATPGATQATSRTVTSSFTVTEEAPAAALKVTSIADGHEFPFGEGPSGVSGTGEPGAGITVTVGGETYTATVDENGAWAVDFGTRLVSDVYELTATQSIEGADDTSVTISFTVAAEGDAGGNAGGGEGNANGDDDDLANTGGASALPWALGAGALLIAGAATILIARRNQATEL